MLAGLAVLALIAAAFFQFQQHTDEVRVAPPSTGGDSGMDETEQERLMRKIGYIM
jgi:hypothetical protein